jgi:hypothetical protein
VAAQVVWHGTYAEQPRSTGFCSRAALPCGCLPRRIDRQHLVQPRSAWRAILIAPAREETPSLPRMLLTWAIDRPGAEDERLGILAIGLRQDQQPQHFEFAGRETSKRGRSSACWASKYGGQIIPWGMPRPRARVRQCSLNTGRLVLVSAMTCAYSPSSNGACAVSASVIAS